MNKKGFTLVELLAVIAILAILVVVALPNVLSMFNNAKKDLFLTEAKNVFKESASKYINDNMHSSNAGNIYCKSETDSKNPLDMDSNDTYYYIEKDNMGKTIKLVIWNDSGFVTKHVSDEITLNDITSESVNEDTISGITCDNVLTKLDVIPKLTKSYNVTASAFFINLSQNIELTGKIISSSTTDEFNKVKYIIYRKNVDNNFIKIKELVQTNKSEDFKFSYIDIENEKILDDTKYKIEAYTENNIKISEIISNYTYCFVAGTKVKTENGFKNIEDIKVGEKVYSYNLENNELELKEVINTVQSSTIDTYKMTIGNKTVEMSPKHQIYIIDKGWVRAYNVNEGDMMLSLDGEKIKITKIEYKRYDSLIKTYNLTIEGNSNYFVTDIQVLVHNAPSASEY